MNNEIDEMWRAIKDLQNRIHGAPLRPAQGVGGLTIKKYTTFPAIPTVRETVIWCKSLLCSAAPGDDYWRLCTGKFTDETGEVGT